MPLVGEFEIFARLLAATAVGMILGLDRDLRGKPTGMRTLGLVSLGAAIVSLAVLNIAEIAGHADALSRVLQGILQGVLTGVGFIGAGVIMRDPQHAHARGLTTAAGVWIAATLGIACGLGQWTIVAIGFGFALVLLVLLRGLDHDLRRRHRARNPQEEAVEDD